MALRIKSADRFVVNVPLTPRCEEWNALMVYNWRILEIIRVELEGGIVGWGESIPVYTWTKTTDEALLAVPGMNPVEFMGDDSIGAGLQMALYDAVGKALEIPAHCLFPLPKIRDWCPLGWWNTKMPPEALAEEAKEAVSKGYTAHKIKTRPWLDCYAQTEAISAVTPEHYRIDMDWNDMLLHVGIATPILQELEKHPKVALFEGPLPQRDIEGYRHLRGKIAKPIVAHIGVPAFPVAVRSEMCDGFVFSECGAGIAMTNGALCAAFEKPFWLQAVGAGLTTAWVAQLGAVLSHARWPAITCMNNYADDLLSEPLRIEDGYVQVPTAPGLGVTFNTDTLSRYAMQPPYLHTERRHIITVEWPSGRRLHYATMVNRQGNHATKSPFSHAANATTLDTHRQMWEDFLMGNHPIEPRGAQMTVQKDDGSSEWADLYARTQKGPVWSGR